MKLKSLTLAVAVLALLSGLTWFLRRPAPPPAADPRVGKPLLDSATVERAARIAMTDKGRSVVVVKGTGDTWTVPGYFDFPADLPKLIQFINVLHEATMDRLVTSNPDYIARLGFADTSVSLQDAAAKDLWSVVIGKPAEKSGTFVRFPAENKAYLSNVSVFIDTEPENWVDRRLVELPTETIAAFELNFPAENGASLRFTRPAKDAPFVSTDSRKPRQETLNNLVALYTSIQFSTTADIDSAGTRDAQANARTLKLTTFDGKTLTLAIGQPPPPPQPTKAPDTGEFVPPPQPAYISIVHSDPAAPVNALMKKRAFQAQVTYFTTLPAKSADLFEDPAAMK